jgi:hypothetical protein
MVMVSRELLLNQAGIERNPTLIELWRENLRVEVEAELMKHFFVGSQQFLTALDQAMLHIEQYGCSVQKAISRILEPDDFIGMPLKSGTKNA